MQEREALAQSWETALAVLKSGARYTDRKAGTTVYARLFQSAPEKGGRKKVAPKKTPEGEWSYPNVRTNYVTTGVGLDFTIRRAAAIPVGGGYLGMCAEDLRCGPRGFDQVGVALDFDALRDTPSTR